MLFDIWKKIGYGLQRISYFTMEGIGDRFAKHGEGVEVMKKETERVRPVRTLEELRELAAGNETLERLYREMREYMFRYAETVLEFNEILTRGLSDEDTNRAFQDMDAVRTRVHNGLIDAVNIFSRALAKFDKDNSWVGTFQGARAAYGRFALGATAQAIIQHERELAQRKEAA